MGMMPDFSKMTDAALEAAAKPRDGMTEYEMRTICAELKRRAERDLREADQLTLRHQCHKLGLTNLVTGGR
jgi:hypothetical protein